MNVTDWIDSADVAAHLKQIGYAPAPADCAWLIWQNRNMTLKQRFAAWRELIAATADQPFSAGGRELPSLHGFLRDYMALKRRKVKQFLRAENDTVYTYELLWSDGQVMRGQGVYATYDDCFAEAASACNGLQLAAFLVYRQAVGFFDSLILHVATTGEIIGIADDSLLPDDENLLLYGVFQAMQPRIPLPFARGDLLEPVPYRYDAPEEGERLCVFDGYEKKDGQRGEKIPISLPFAYIVEAGGAVLRLPLDQAICYRRARCLPTDEEQILLPLSACLKGEIDLAQLLSADRALTAEQQIKSVRRAALCELSPCYG